MPNPAKGARLYLRKRKGRPSIYVIRDGQEEISTGCGPSERRGAEKALEAHLATKHNPVGGDRDPVSVLIADATTFYSRTRAPDLADPERVGTAFMHLLPFWGGMTVSEIRGETCRAYTSARLSAGAAVGTVRRELEALQAAVRYFCKEGHLTGTPLFTMPEKPQPKARWMTREEAGALLAEADRLPHTQHIGLFIRIGLLTGTRHRAILGLQWMPNTTGGWIDFDAGLMYRKGIGVAETKKRRPTCKIPAALLPHLEAAKQSAAGTHLIEYGGHPLLSVKKSFAATVRRAGLSKDITPHVLRHTCATWLAQAGVSMFKAGELIGCSAAEFERTYAHHSPDFQNEASDAISAAFGGDRGANLGHQPKIRLV